MLRKGKETDVNEICELMNALEETKFDIQQLQIIYQQQLLNEQYYALCYEENGKVKGILNLRFENQLHHCGKVAEIMEFIISEECRNQGIGKEMMQEAIRIAKEKGCILIELDTNQKRKAAHRFYEREGLYNTHYKFVKEF